MATGQDAPCRGKRTTLTSWQKYLPPNCAPMPTDLVSSRICFSSSVSRKPRPCSLPETKCTAWKYPLILIICVYILYFIVVFFCLYLHIFVSFSYFSFTKQFSFRLLACSLNYSLVFSMMTSQQHALCHRWKKKHKTLEGHRPMPSQILSKTGGRIKSPDPGDF